MRCGVYGGSFDPIHLGHVAAAERAREERGLDLVWLVPAGQAPHKRGCRASFRHRLAMIELAIRGHEGLAALDLEGRREGVSFTIDTLEALERLHPDAELELLVGADMLEDLPRWRRAADVVARARIVAFGRPGTPADAARAAFEAVFGRDRYVWLDFEPLPASSSEVRRRLARDESVEGLLDPSVAAYVRREGVYKEGG